MARAPAPRTLVALATLATLATLACAPGPARAQDVTEEPPRAIDVALAQAASECDDAATDRADTAYRDAYAALARGLAQPDGSRARLEPFVEAKRLFEAAFHACPHARYGFALAAALRQFGELRASLSLFERLVQDALPGELLAEQQASLASVLEELRARVVELRVRIQGAERATLRVDGSSVGRIGQRETRHLILDPGRHLVDAVSAGYLRAERTLVIESGERRNVLLRMVPDDRVPSGSILEEPWLWITIGILVVGGVTTALLLTTEQPVTESPLGTVDI